MEERRYLPTIAEFDRYIIPYRVRLLKGMHRKLTEKYDWFVRYDTSYGIRPFYINGSFKEVVEVATIEAPFAEILNCNWSPETWNAIPYLCNVFKNKETVEVEVTEQYRSWYANSANNGYNGNVIGYKKKDVWLTKYFDDRDLFYFGGRYDNYWSLNKSGIYANWHGVSNEFYVGKFMYKELQKNAPSDVILPLLRAMSAKKWRGFYDTEIDFILEVTGEMRSQI
ncbi:hypothetical protein AB1282_00355 [Gottfriedia sp. S16(2024)]|uniref:hypothetical protein n=1 Tax=Gottfriedia sp. S16(2024) TaxID=3162883 RepID=UPI003D1B6E47